MLVRVLSSLVFLVVQPAAMATAGEALQTGRALLTPQGSSSPLQSGLPGGSLLAAHGAPYTSRPSGLDRIDPANMRVFGGEIGGNGVKGGAVVSLTWPTQP
jgi:hypothetical protein